MKRTRSIIFIYFLFFAITTLGQSITSGLVLEDVTNKPVIGAAIMFEKGKNVLAITDMNGRFLAKNIQGKSIRISYTGFKPLVVKAQNNATYYLGVSRKTQLHPSPLMHIIS